MSEVAMPLAEINEEPSWKLKKKRGYPVIIKHKFPELKQSQGQHQGSFRGGGSKRVWTSDKLGGCYPSKTHQFWPICKLHWGHFGYFPFFFFLSFFSFLKMIGGGPLTPSSLTLALCYLTLLNELQILLHFFTLDIGWKSVHLKKKIRTDTFNSICIYTLTRVVAIVGGTGRWSLPLISGAHH